jgi:signal transduction histidine kinase
MRVEIFNEGEWIPHDELDSIWDTFYTVEKSHNRQWRGTGIGLAIVRNILLVHGSPHGVRNVEGGVLFHFSLPLANGENQDGSGL